MEKAKPKSHDSQHGLQSTFLPSTSSTLPPLSAANFLPASGRRFNLHLSARICTFSAPSPAPLLTEDGSLPGSQLLEELALLGAQILQPGDLLAELEEYFFHLHRA